MGKCGGLNYAGKAGILPVTATYDNLNLSSHQKPDYPLVSDVTIFSPVGDGIKLTSDLKLTHRFPTVDGNPNSPKQMFMLGS